MTEETATPVAEKPKEAKSAKAAPKTKMSDDHKSKLAEGRKQGAVVRQYLEVLDTHKPKRGRKITPEQIRSRVETIETKLASATPANKLLLIQERIDLEAMLDRAEATPILDELQKDFVKVAKPYAERKGVSYDAFRQAGVPANILKEAGITRAA